MLNATRSYIIQHHLLDGLQFGLSIDSDGFIIFTQDCVLFGSYYFDENALGLTRQCADINIAPG
jgi:hypothetical protein